MLNVPHKTISHILVLINLFQHLVKSLNVPSLSLVNTRKLVTQVIFQLKLSAFVVSLLLLLLEYHVVHANYELRHPTSVLRLEKDIVSSFTKFRQRRLV